jgi:hypothetical protein
MTKSAAGWIRAGFVVGILAGVAYSAQAQNLTYFREYDIQPPANNQPGFTSDGRGGLYASTGDTLRKYDSGGFELWSKQIGIFPALGAVIVFAANASGVFVAGGTLSSIVLPGHGARHEPAQSSLFDPGQLPRALKQPIVDDHVVRICISMPQR